MTGQLALVALTAAFLCQVALAARGTSCNCGWVNKGRVVGGHETKKNEYPWMAALYNKFTGSVGCGAAIITQYHALTASHCNPLVNTPGLVLLVGAHDIRDRRTGTQVPIERFIMNGDYNTSVPVSDDIAVIVTRTPIPFGVTVGPVCMPTGPIKLENQIVTATGWGRVGWAQSGSPVLKGFEIKVISRQHCKMYWNLREPNGQICVMENRLGPCEGDSGGPWVWLDPETKRYTLIGLTSYGGECVYPPPAVTTEVGAYVPWVKDVIRANKPQNICTKV